MTRVVVDTNVIVSAFLKAKSDPALIVSLILNREMTLCLSDNIFNEYQEVLARDKFKQLNQQSVRKLLEKFKTCALWV